MLWLEGRKGIFEQLTAVFNTNHYPVIWMHTSSLGEFEQGLPLLENIRKQYTGYKILLTFFSPSGYEIRKDYKGVDYIFYLPIDSPANATRFLHIVQPKLILFIKYEFWYYYLQQASQKKIPLILVSGIFRKNQPFFKWYGGTHRKMLSFFSHLFVQNQDSADLLQSIGLQEKVIQNGDTRFDRVIEIAARFEPLSVIDHFCGNEDIIVAGSTWTEDDEELDHFANTYPSVKWIIAPHDIEQERLDECLSLYKHAMLYSAYKDAYDSNTQIPTDINVLILDNVGMLSKLYHYATICYVGGGFGEDGIHNILEAAVYAKPVIFGPVYDKYVEADELLDSGGAYTVDDALELEHVLNDLLKNREMLKTASEASGAYVKSKAGATGEIMAFIQEKRLLIN